MYTFPQHALPRVVIHRTQVVKEKWKLRVRLSATKENRVHQTKMATKTDKDGSRLRRSGQDWDKKLLLLNF